MSTTNRILLLILLLLPLHLITAQEPDPTSSCLGTILPNGEIEIGDPDVDLQNIDNAYGFSRIWSDPEPVRPLQGYNYANYFSSTNSYDSYTAVPVPADGNYIGCLIDHNSSSTTYRRGFMALLNHTLLPNSGTYTLTFEMACLAEKSQGEDAEIGVYALYNPYDENAPNPPTGAYTPNNLSLFASGATSLLQTISITAGNCSANKSTYTVTINTAAASFPAGGMTHFFIARSDNSSLNGNFYMGFDNFCLPVSGCQGNYNSNAQLEQGSAPTGNQAIGNATSYSGIWNNTSADYFNETSAPSAYSPPTPATGNYASCWIANYLNGGLPYREGFKFQLSTTIPANSGIYELTFDRACLSGWGTSELAIYGIYNPSNGFSVSPTGHYTPNNTTLFGASNTVLLDESLLTTSNCNSTKSSQTITIDSDDPNFPSNGLTHIFLTHSDDQALSGAHYMAFDNFCLHAILEEIECPNISEITSTCLPDMNGDGLPEIQLGIVVSSSVAGSVNIGALYSDLITQSDRITPSSFSITGAGTYNTTLYYHEILLQQNGDFALYVIQNAAGQDCRNGFDTIPNMCPPSCACDSVFNNSTWGIQQVVEACAGDQFIPTGFANTCEDSVVWTINGVYVGSTIGRDTLVVAHQSNTYTVCMTVIRTGQAVQCSRQFCQSFTANFDCNPGGGGTGLLAIPNPASNTVTITWPTRAVPEEITLYLYDSRGILVKQHPLTGPDGQFQTNIEELPQGIYILQLEGKEYHPAPIQFIKK